MTGPTPWRSDSAPRGNATADDLEKEGRENRQPTFPFPDEALEPVLPPVR